MCVTRLCCDPRSCTARCEGFFAPLGFMLYSLGVILWCNIMAKRYLLINQTQRVISTRVFVKKFLRDKESIVFE